MVSVSTGFALTEMWLPIMQCWLATCLSQREITLDKARTEIEEATKEHPETNVEKVTCTAGLKYS